MSLIEVLVATVLMAVIALGILPLFQRSTRMNREGGNYTELTNIARSSLEEYSQADFNGPSLAIPVGSTELLASQYWNPSTRQWVTWPALASDVPGYVRFRRTVSIQQFRSSDLADNGRLDIPLDGSTPEVDVQLKRVRVTVTPYWQSNEAWGKSTPIALEFIKTF